MRALATVVVLLAGCGSVDGAPCETQGTKRCDGPDVAYCEGSRWVTYPCPAGCDALANSCAWQEPKDGTPCPLAIRGDGVCSADGQMTTCTAVASGSTTWRVLPCQRCVKGADPSTVLRDAGGGLLACD